MTFEEDISARSAPKSSWENTQLDTKKLYEEATKAAIEKFCEKTINKIDLDELESLIQRTKGCFWWRGSTREENRATYKGRNSAVIIWELLSGEVLPEGMQIKHICENPLCVRYSHLELAKRSYPNRA